MKERFLSITLTIALVLSTLVGTLLQQVPKQQREAQLSPTEKRL